MIQHLFIFKYNHHQYQNLNNIFTLHLRRRRSNHRPNMTGPGDVTPGNRDVTLAPLTPADMLYLNQSIRAYRFVSQGKTTIPGVDDGEMMLECDVSTGC